MPSMQTNGWHASTNVLSKKNEPIFRSPINGSKNFVFSNTQESKHVCSVQEVTAPDGTRHLSVWCQMLHSKKRPFLMFYWVARVLIIIIYFLAVFLMKGYVYIALSW